jgi:prepilin-type N-terminal cleavage/methylation domain-containing protein
MKIQIKQSSHRGFTLVELLVVILIIIILAAIGSAAYLGVLQKARMTTSLSSATNVANAVEAFYSEYNLLPAPTSGAPDEDNDPAYKTNATDGIDVLEVLARLEEENDDMQNDRKLLFLGVKESENGNRDGVVYNSAGDEITGLFDAWGQPFYIVMDYDYDGRLEFSVDTSAYNYDVKLNNKRVAVYSLGTDLPDDAKRKDLVKTW